MNAIAHTSTYILLSPRPRSLRQRAGQARRRSYCSKNGRAVLLHPAGVHMMVRATAEAGHACKLPSLGGRLPACTIPHQNKCHAGSQQLAAIQSPPSSTCRSTHPLVRHTSSSRRIHFSWGGRQGGDHKYLRGAVSMRAARRTSYSANGKKDESAGDPILAVHGSVC